MPSPEQENITKNGTYNEANAIDDQAIAKKSHTASKMLSLFRQMEEQKTHNQFDTGPKPLKRFTPPPSDDNRRVYNDSDGEDYTDEEVEEVSLE